MKLDRIVTKLLATLVALSPTTSAWADPCGMVPPIYLGDGPPITRIGVQKTYVFYRNGIESLVIRPGFSGKVDSFGMLIPFPSPPAIRKVADDVFPHIAAAIDPPEVLVDLRMRFRGCYDMAAPMGARSEQALEVRKLGEEEVQVISEEAVGMYEVAVLAAGSAGALKLWMEDHGFRYPDGMDDVCEDYVEDGWCFVAIKARVGQKAGSEPRPGMRTVETGLPEDATFEGHVQAMGFRFRTDEFVVPMRLSAFNEGELRNIVYILSDGPQRIANLSEDMVVRQIPGYQLYRNVTDPLPLRIVGGGVGDIPDWWLQSLPAQRNPVPHNGIARELFASDILAARTGQLSHPHEEREKELLEIGERLGLRGPQLDALHAEALREERERMVNEALAELTGMTLTVVDGDFPREVIAAENLEFSPFAMATGSNRQELYDARFEGPAPVSKGSLFGGSLPDPPVVLGLLAMAVLLALGLYAVNEANRRRVHKLVALSAVVAGGLFLLSDSGTAAAQTPALPSAYPALSAIDAGFLGALEAQENEIVDRLLAEARGGESPTSRGWAIVALAEIGGRAAESTLGQLQSSANSNLVRVWASAALVHLADSPGKLATQSDWTATYPVLVRPVAKRWLALLGDPDSTVRLEVVLDALARSYPLQQKCLPRLLERETREFVEVMFSAQSQNARNLAAACLATLSGQGRQGIPGAVLASLRYDPAAEQVPWSGGPLFIPSLSWGNEPGRQLWRELVAWHLFCDRNELKAEQTQINNNLNSWALANAAGYQLPGRQLGSTRWLLLFGEIAGVEELESLLEEQGLEDQILYKAILQLASHR